MNFQIIENLQKEGKHDDALKILETYVGFHDYVMYLKTISAYYCKRNEYMRYVHDLIDKKIVRNDHYFSQVNSFRGFYADKLKGQVLDLPRVDEPFHNTMNPCIFDKNLINMRVVNYKIVNGCYYDIETGQCFSRELPVNTKNFVRRITDDGFLDKQLDIHVDEPSFANIVGAEDVRFVKHSDGNITGICNVTGSYGQRQMCILYNYPNIVCNKITGYGDGQTQKNWTIVQDKPTKIIYSFSPLIVLDVHGGTVKECLHKEVDLSPDVRGGSPLIRFNNGYLTCVHEVIYNNGDRCYFHRFIMLNLSLDEVIGRSNLFYFIEPQFTIEFVCGMVCDGDEVVISFGNIDKSAHLIRVQKAEVEKLLD